MQTPGPGAPPLSFSDPWTFPARQRGAVGKHTKHFLVALTPELYKRLRAFSKATDVNIVTTLRHALTWYLNNQPAHLVPPGFETLQAGKKRKDTP